MVAPMVALKVALCMAKVACEGGRFPFKIYL